MQDQGRTCEAKMSQRQWGREGVKADERPRRAKHCLKPSLELSRQSAPTSLATTTKFLKTT